MANITVGQIIMEVQRMASRVKDLDAISSSLLVEAEGNNRMVESLRQFQDDMDSLNRISNNKTNAEMVNRIQQQNANSSEILKENRELKICLEDYELAMEMVMKKYREHVGSKILDSKINFRDLQNEKLWNIIREQREKINEMAAVMQRAAYADDENICRDIETMNRLRLENKTLREMLQISKQFGSNACPIKYNELQLVEKGVQTECDDSADELSLSGASVENANNNSVIHNNGTNEVTSTIATADVDNVKGGARGAATAISYNAAALEQTVIDNAAKALLEGGDNNNGPLPGATTAVTPLAVTATTATTTTSVETTTTSAIPSSSPSQVSTAATSQALTELNNSNDEDAVVAAPSADPSFGACTLLEVEIANANTLKSPELPPPPPPSHASAT